MTLSSLASVASPRIALFSHGGDGAPIVHSASGLCLSQAVAKERAPYTLTMFHVNQGSFAGITDMDLGDAGGDALFDFRIPSQRWACIQQGGRSQFPAQCDNPVACWAMMMMKFKLLTAVLLHPLKLITTTTKRCTAVQWGFREMTRVVPCHAGGVRPRHAARSLVIHNIWGCAQHGRLWSPQIW